MRMNYSVEGAEEWRNITPVEIGRHLVSVSKVVEKDKSGAELFTAKGRPKIRVFLTVLRGESKGRSIMDEVVFFKKGEPGLGLTKHKLKVMGAPYDDKRKMFVGMDTQALVGTAEFFINVIPRQQDGGMVDPKYPTKVGEYEYANANRGDDVGSVESDKEIVEDYRKPSTLEQVSL